MPVTSIENLRIQLVEIKDTPPPRVDIVYFLDGSLEIQSTMYLSRLHRAFTVYLFFPPSYLKRFPDLNLIQSLGLHDGPWQADEEVCCRMEPILTQLVELELEKRSLRSLYQEGCSLQLLYLCLEKHTERQETPCFNCRFLNIPSEKQKIMQARVLLMINLSEPLSIPELARAVLINECYLKKGFRELFGSSVYDFVQQERIRKAKLFLQEGRYSIQEIALELGFSNTSNFTNAFKRLTGQPPTSWQKTLLEV